MVYPNDHQVREDVLKRLTSTKFDSPFDLGRLIPKNNFLQFDPSLSVYDFYNYRPESLTMSNLYDRARLLQKAFFNNSGWDSLTFDGWNKNRRVTVNPHHRFPQCLEKELRKGNKTLKDYPQANDQNIYHIHSVRNALILNVNQSHLYIHQIAYSLTQKEISKRNRLLTESETSLIEAENIINVTTDLAKKKVQEITPYIIDVNFRSKTKNSDNVSLGMTWLQYLKFGIGVIEEGPVINGKTIDIIPFVHYEHVQKYSKEDIFPTSEIQKLYMLAMSQRLNRNDVSQNLQGSYYY